MNIDAWQQACEEQVAEYKLLLESGDLSQSEYEELVNDLIVRGQIQEALNTEDLKNKAVKAIDAIKVVAGLIA